MSRASSGVALLGSNGIAGQLLRRQLAEQPASEAVNRFVDQLTELPVGVWLSLGRELSDGVSLPVRQQAWTEVEAAIAEHGLDLAAWHVRDAIETVVFLVSRQTSHWSRDERCAFAAAHGAAEATALALLAQPFIRREVVRSLCAPFVSHVDAEVWRPPKGECRELPRQRRNHK